MSEKITEVHHWLSSLWSTTHDPCHCRDHRS